jgi:hypothetical protein
MSSSDAWTVLIRLFTWTPQVLLVVFAAVVLRQGMRSLPRQKARKRAWVLPLSKMLAAYGLVLYVLGMQMKEAAIPPFSHAGNYLGPHYAEFWEMATPSLWALPMLVVVHIFCWLENLTLQRAELAKSAPPAE